MAEYYLLFVAKSGPYDHDLTISADYVKTFMTSRAAMDYFDERRNALLEVWNRDVFPTEEDFAHIDVSWETDARAAVVYYNGISFKVIARIKGYSSQENEVRRGWCDRW